MVARSCRSTGNSRKTAENTVGISTPPAKPWTIRQAISVAKPLLAAQPIEARVKRLMAMRKSRLMPSTRMKRPVSGMAITSAIK